MNTLMSHRLALFSVGVLLLALGFSSQVAAQTNNPNRALLEKMQRVQQRAQALEEEKSALQSDKDQTTAALKRAQRELSRVQSANASLLATLKADLSQQTTENENLKSRLATAESRLSELETEWRREQAKLGNSTQALQETRLQLEAQTQSLNVCKANNVALFEINTELLDKYEAAYKASSILRGGLLTKLDWVKVENERADIQDRLSDARVR